MAGAGTLLANKPFYYSESFATSLDIPVQGWFAFYDNTPNGQTVDSVPIHWTVTQFKVTW
jgi:hypothetical protein